MGSVDPEREYCLCKMTVLVAEWRKRARRQMDDARNEPDDNGKVMILHGAAIYEICAEDLLALMIDIANQDG